MKIAISILMLSVFAQADEIYKVSHSAAAQGFVEVGYDRDRGVTIYYPDSYQMQVFNGFNSSLYVSESLCKTYVKSLVDEVVAIQDKNERKNRIQQDLVEKDSSTSFRIDYFPFWGDKFYERVESVLRENGVSGAIGYRYPIAEPKVHKLDLSFKSGALTPRLNDVAIKDVLFQQDNAASTTYLVASNYLPLACDMLLGNVNYKIDWTIDLVSNAPIWHEPISEKQVFSVYQSLQSLQDLVPGERESSLAERAFIQGALASQVFKQEVGEISKSNVKVFSEMMRSFFDRYSFSANTLTTNELQRVYGKLLIKEEESIHFKGVAHAN